MGQKVNPNGFRLCTLNTWDSLWFAVGRDYVRKLREDIRIRGIIKSMFKLAAISRVIIERPAKKVIVNIQSARPGIVIGKKGSDIAKIRDQIFKLTQSNVSINITEIRRFDAVPELVAQSLAIQLEKRVSFRKAMKRAIISAMKLKVKGIRINVKGRLGGAEIARKEWYREGRVPLHTLRANVRYASVEANTIYGIVGVKVWVCIDGNEKILDNK